MGEKTSEEVSDYDVVELERNAKAQVDLGMEILEKLEKAGICRYVYHRLFAILLKTDRFYTDERPDLEE